MTTTQQWQTAFDAYTALRAASDALADDHPDCDRATDDYCDAMDRLIATPAPSHHALTVKIDLIESRFADFAIGPDIWQRIRDDIAQLGKGA